MTRNLLPELFLDRPLRQFPTLWSSYFPNLIENLEEDLLSQDSSARGTRIYKENDQLHVEVPLPGLNLKDIEVSLNKGVLLVKGKSVEEEKDPNKEYYRSSKRDYSFTLALPSQIDENQKPEAVYSDGIVKVSLQLAKQGETKKIPVKAGNSKK